MNTITTDVIPKYPFVPELTKEQIEIITDLVFLPKQEPVSCDAIFVFGCPDPVIWDVVNKLYRSKMGAQIIVTGGYNPNPKLPQKNWNYGPIPEAQVIVKELISLGIPEDIIFYEDRSKNSLQNVQYAKEIFDFQSIESLLFVCKEPAAGRQYRTLKRHLPQNILLVPAIYPTNLGGDTPLLTRYNWMDTHESRSFIFGNFLRNIVYSRKGDIFPIENPLPEFEQYISIYYKPYKLNHLDPA